MEAASTSYFMIFEVCDHENLNRPRRPAGTARICREGVETRLIGRTSIDGIPLVPAQVRLLWGFISTQFFRARLLRVLWPDLGDARVTGLPAMRVLSINGVFREIPDGLLIVTEPAANRVTFQQVDFKRPLHEVANAISLYTAKESIRGNLPSWSGL